MSRAERGVILALYEAKWLAQNEPNYPRDATRSRATNLFRTLCCSTDRGSIIVKMKTDAAGWFCRREHSGGSVLNGFIIKEWVI